jgi:hypothetical protein
MKQCPNGHEVSDNVKFCPECGAEIKDNGTKFCAKCGNERKGTEKFCSQCGTPYGQSLTSNVSEIEVSQDKSSKKGILIAAVVAIIALLGGAAWYFLGNQNNYSLEGLAKAVVNYDEVCDFHEGLARVYKGDKYGFIDKMGNEVIPCVYEQLMEADPNFHDGLALVHQGEKYFFINKEGKEAFPYNYDTGLNFSDGLALVWKDRKCGYIDTKGNEVIALTDKYYGTSFHDGLAAVGNNDGKYGFIDKKGELVIPMSFDVDEGGVTSEFHEGYAVVCKNEKYGYIDKSGKEVIPCNYDAAFNFSEGMALVIKEGKFGFIDAKGKEVIPCEYSYANHFSEGIAVVQKGDKYQFIDKTGKVVLDNSYCGIPSKFQEGFSVVGKEGEKNEYYTQYVYGIIDKNGKEIIPCIYNTCNLFSEGLAVVKKDDIYGFVDKKGNSTFDIQNEEVKKIIQAKIKEREETRKEEERRAEEERKRIEENKGGIELYKIASESSQKMVAYSCELDYNPKSSNREVVTYALYLYPRDESSGEAHFAQFRAKVNFNYENKYTWVEDRYYQYLAGENDYCVARYEYKKGELYIYAYNVKAYLTNETLRLDFEVASDGNSLRQIDKGLHFRRGFETSAPNDPFKK